ncbi:MAG TPA: hypothetical protein VFO41_11115, partial [Alphaproteobacteria bacterium]|nr:hypothetical protein [Alphaproteobacteria bacterium]
MPTSSMLNASNAVVPALSHGAGAAAALVLMLSLLVNWSPNARNAWMLVACFAGVASGVAGAVALNWAPWSIIVGALAGLARSASWCAFLLAILRSEQEGRPWSPRRPSFWLLATLVLATTITLSADLASMS